MYKILDYQTEREKRLSDGKNHKYTILELIDDINKLDVNFIEKDLIVFIREISKLEYYHAGLNRQQYLRHPIRVARILMSYSNNVSINEIKLALSHNIIEVTQNSSSELIDILGLELYELIKMLTVDRNHQWDSVYKNCYYNNIAKNESTAVVKIIDKFDNIFLLSDNPDISIKNKYIEEIENHIFPLINKFMPGILTFFKKNIKIIKKEIKL